MRELFIYYRSHEDHAASVQARVHEFQAALRRAHPGLLARLLRRPEVKNGLLTWMETYSIDRSLSSRRFWIRVAGRLSRRSRSLPYR